MRDENDKLKKLNYVNVTFHRDITEKLDSDSQSMIQVRNELQQLRVMNLQNNLDREEFEKRLQIANQHTVVVHTDEEEDSFSHRVRHNLPKPNGISRTGRQQANSTELLGHDHATTVMSKVSRCVFEILPQDEEEVIRGSETPETPEEEKVSMTRSMFKNIMAQALEDQKKLADVTSAEEVKAVFTKGVKHRSEMQTQAVHSSSMKTETVHQNPITPSKEYGLNTVHLQRPATSNTMAPSVVNNTIPVQQTANIPVVSTNNGVLDGNKTLETMSSFNTGKRYKIETSLKFSDGSVELYESFESQFNIHHKLLSWDTRRAGVELYMNLVGKNVQKIEEVIMNANDMSNITEMWDALDHAFLPIDHRESKYRQFSTRRWRFGERMTEYLDKLIHVFRKARPGIEISFQDEEVRNQLFAGLSSDIVIEIDSYLDLTAAEIAQKYDVIHSQREALRRATVVAVEKPLFAVQDKQTRNDDPQIAATNKLAMDSILDRLDKMNLKE